MSITLEQVSKHYDTNAAVNDVSVDIADGEFFVLLGPSGSGKSTLLRAIAGLTPIDHGRILLHGSDVTHVTAREREVGFVFQNYALFRHMSVADNIEFALCARRVRAAERRRRRLQLLELVALEGYGDRLPAELSGGQQQRVALARALAHEPRVLLLDEPFGALDAKIRDDLRRSVRDIQRAVGITTILVTHDQDEAFKMADRIGVMDRGRLQETGAPRALYAHPRTRFVATFLGAANLLLGRYDADGVRVGDAQFDLDEWPIGAQPGAEATVVIRPEELVIVPASLRAAKGKIGQATVRELEFVGAIERIRVSATANERLIGALQPDAEHFLLDASRNAREAEAVPLAVGDRVDIGAKRVHVLPTRINSLRLIGEPREREALARARVVAELSQSMHITAVPYGSEATQDVTEQSGLLVTRLGGDRSLAGAISLLEGGAHQVLALAPQDQAVARMLLYVQPSRPARDSGLSVAGSLLRHLPVDASLLVPAGERPRYGSRYRELLDLRSAALRLHGVDVRAETFDGGVVAAIAARLRTQDVPTLLLVGMTSVATGQRFIQELSELIANEPRVCAALLVCGRAGGERVSSPVGFIESAAASAR